MGVLDVKTARRIFSRFFQGVNNGMSYTQLLLCNSFAAMLFELGTALHGAQRIKGYRHDLSVKRVRDAWQQGGRSKYSNEIMKTLSLFRGLRD